MVLAAQVIDVWYGLGGIALIFTGAAGTGLLVGQFRKGVIEELRASLETAQTEIGINREIIGRLEAAMTKLDGRCEHLENENSALRTAVETGAALVPHVQAVLAQFEDRIAARHKILAQALPEPIKTALLDALR